MEVGGGGVKGGADFKYLSLPSAASSSFYPSTPVTLPPADERQRRSGEGSGEAMDGRVKTEQPDREPLEGLFDYFCCDTVTVFVCCLQRNTRNSPPTRFSIKHRLSVLLLWANFPSGVLGFTTNTRP